MSQTEVNLPVEWSREIDGWLEDKSANTVKAYTRYVKKLYNFLTANELPTEFDKITPAHLRDFGSHVRKNESPSNRRPMISAIKSLWKYLHSYEVVQKNSSLSLKIPRPVAISRERSITVEQVKEIFDKAEKREDKALLALLYYCGLRISEATNVKKEDINKSGDTWNVSVVGKGQKFRRVDLNKRAKEIISDYMEGLSSESEYLFPGQRKKDNKDRPICSDTGARRIKKIVKKAGYPEVTCHYFRHGIATHLLQADVDLGSISKMLGHASIATTGIYIHAKEGCITENIE